MQSLIDRNLIDTALSYNSYKELTEELLAQGKTTGPNQSESYHKYTELNYQRVKRLDKTLQLNEELVKVINSIEEKMIWLVLVEAWCGDVAQNLPAINKMAELNNNIELKLILRDEHPDVMDGYLTNGGRSIPKLIMLSSELEELAVWGPRPAEVQQMVMDYKADPDRPAYDEFSVKVQKWYNQDKTESLQDEFTEILKAVSVI